MANPMLNDDRLRAAAAASDTQAGWAAPPPGTQPGTQWNPPVSDGPVSTWQSGTMTVAGTAQVTAILLGLLLVSGAFGWAAVDVDTAGNAEFPPLAIVGIIVGVGCVFGLMFKPQLAKFLAPVYAIGQGFAVGAISRGYETYQDGIVLQAVGATLGVFLVMLFLYRTNIIKVTDKYRRIVIGATLGIMVFYGVSLLIRLFGGSVPFINSPSAFGIIFSLVVAAIAAANLALDFDFIERGASQRLPKNVEWFAAFGLLVTIVWLYLEILRLLAKLNRR